MAALDDLLARITDPALRAELEREIRSLRADREFGLVFERHLPEGLRLPGHSIRRGLTVEERDTHGSGPWLVSSVKKKIAHLQRRGNDGEIIEKALPVGDLVVVREFGDPIHPGLESVGRIERGSDKPFHAVINGENYHVLETLLYTCEGQVDCIYIDPPYNTGAKDWKYNNDYVDELDSFRHSKWLSFMEKRLRLSKRLLRSDNSILLVTIDDNEAHTLGLLLEQIFPECERQMVSITISPRGKSREGRLSQVDEYALIVYVGAAGVATLEGTSQDAEIRWRGLRRTDIESARGTPKGGPRQFYPIYVDKKTQRIVKIGDPLRPRDSITSIPTIRGAVPVFPIRKDGRELNWSVVGQSLQNALDEGYVRVSPGSHSNEPFTFTYLTHPNIKKVRNGTYKVTGTRPDGSKIVVIPGGKPERPTTAWREKRHDAGAYGTSLLGDLLPDRKFPFPKSLYAVEDTLRLFLQDKPSALVLDFFGGSGTTTHALSRLNRQDGGRRRSILVTNNEVALSEAQTLRDAGYRPGTPEWERLGIFEYITRPRLTAAITGLRQDGTPLEGEYTFTDTFPMSDGFEENIDFLKLTYEDRDQVSLGAAFEAIAPLLWIKAGAEGPRINKIHTPWSLPPSCRYAILFDTSGWRTFVDCVNAAEQVRHAFIVTNSVSAFQQIVRELPTEVAPLQLYEDYLSSFEINTGGVS